MRNEMVKKLLEIDAPDMLFMTGDLGYHAFEPLRDAMGHRFINPGVAEQNMVSMAGAMAENRWNVWVYSIAPFLYARACEQIRNDVSLRVKLIGAGGGYCYGAQGESHHALEDYGILLALGLDIYVPALVGDTAKIVERMASHPIASYLRLSRPAELEPDIVVTPYSSCRCLLDGDKGVMVVVGPMVGDIVNHMQALPLLERPAVWVVTEFGCGETGLSRECEEAINFTERLFVVEEHYPIGGYGSLLLLEGIRPEKFYHLAAQGKHSLRYGSQKWHLGVDGLDGESVAKFVMTVP